MKYIDSKKLIAEIERMREVNRKAFIAEHIKSEVFHGRAQAINHLFDFITSLQQEQPDNMIQWTGNNLKEVIDFTGKSPRFGEWFKSWEEYENYVHTHNDILKLFCEDGSHYEVPIGAWIVKTPDGYNVPSVSRFVWKQPEVDLEKEIDDWYNTMGIPVTTDALKETARHFYELGLNTRKEE